MKTDYFLILQAVTAFFLCMVMLSNARRTKESVMHFAALFFFIIMIRSCLSYFFNLTNLDLVPVEHPGDSIFKMRPDPLKAPLYDFRIFAWQAIELILPLSYAFYIIPAVFISLRKERSARIAKNIILTISSTAAAVVLLIIVPSVMAGPSAMYQTDSPAVEFVKSHIGYHLIAFLRISIPLVIIWFINLVWGSAVVPGRMFSRDPEILVMLMCAECAFAVITWIINPFFHSIVFSIQIIPLIILIIYSRKIVADQYLQLQGRMENIVKERHMIVSLVRKIGSSISTENFSLGTVSEDILGSAVKVLNANSGALFMFEQEGNLQILRAKHVSGIYPPKKISTVTGTESQMNDRVLHETILPGEGLIGEIAMTGKGVLIEDTADDSRYVQTLPGMLYITSFMAVPLISHDEVFGVLAVTNDIRRFRKEDYSLLEILANFDHMAFTINSYALHMSELVKTKTAEVEKLLEIQNGDYYLTSLLLKPLMLNEARSSKTKVDSYLDQKKKFNFRKWNAEIGGDICIAHTIILQDKRYTVFTNADAMGKSIQGAGGALVFGVAFISYVMRTINNRLEQNMTPGDWLEQIYRDLQAVFESFDGSMLISAVVGLVDEDSGLMWHFNCEHPWTVLYRKGIASFIDSDDKTGRKIGTIGIAEMVVQITQLDPGDMVLIGSDGRDDLVVGTDSSTGNRIINEDETLFLRHVERGNGSPKEISAAIVQTGELTDDLSLMRIRYLGREGGIMIESAGVKDKMNTFISEALSLYRSGLYEKGLSLLASAESFLETKDDKYKVFNLLGNIYYKIKRYDEALSYWRAALANNPESIQLQKNIDLLERKKK